MTPPSPRAAARYARVARVLLRVLVLNLAVAVAKIAFGYATGAISILSDGFHSLTDAASNVVGLVGVRAARKPPDEDHPYGHRKYETLAAAGDLRVPAAAWSSRCCATRFNQLTGGAAPHESPASSFVVMLVTLGDQPARRRATSGRGARGCSSEVLLADAMQTRSDVLTSCAVIVALVGGAARLSDPRSARRRSWSRLHRPHRLSDRARHDAHPRAIASCIAEDDIRTRRDERAGVLGCHQIRTRGSADHVFLDLHVWFRADMPLHEAHRLSHVVKDRLMARYPQIADAIIHIEPPPSRDSAGRRLGTEALIRSARTLGRCSSFS